MTQQLSVSYPSKRAAQFGVACSCHTSDRSDVYEGMTDLQKLQAKANATRKQKDELKRELEGYKKQIEIEQKDATQAQAKLDQVLKKLG